MRRLLAGIAGLVAAVALAATVLSGWVDRTIVQTEGFVDLTSELSGSETIREQVRDLVVEGLVDDAGLDSQLAGTIGDLLARAAEAALGDDAYAAAWEQTIRRSHEATLSGQAPDGEFRLELAPIAAQVAERSGGLVPPPESVPLDVEGGPSRDRLADVHEIADAAQPSALVAAVAAVLALLVARRRAAALAWLGAGAIAAAALVVAVAAGLPTWSTDTVDPAFAPLARTIAEAAADSLRDEAVVPALGGAIALVVGAVGALLTRRSA